MAFIINTCFVCGCVCSAPSRYDKQIFRSTVRELDEWSGFDSSEERQIYRWMGRGWWSIGPIDCRARKEGRHSNTFPEASRSGCLSWGRPCHLWSLDPWLRPSTLHCMLPRQCITYTYSNLCLKFASPMPWTKEIYWRTFICWWCSPSKKPLRLCHEWKKSTDGPLYVHDAHQPLFHAAVVNNHIETARVLLEFGVDVEQTDMDGRTAISAAAKLGLHDMCQMVL